MLVVLICQLLAVDRATDHLKRPQAYSTNKTSKSQGKNTYDPLIMLRLWCRGTPNKDNQSVWSGFPIQLSSVAGKQGLDVYRFSQICCIVVGNAEVSRCTQNATMS